MHIESDSESIQVSLTLEDEFTLTRIRSLAHDLHGDERDNFLWRTVFKLICRERAFKNVLSEVGISMDPNMELFNDETKE